RDPRLVGRAGGPVGRGRFLPARVRRAYRRPRQHWITINLRSRRSTWILSHDLCTPLLPPPAGCALVLWRFPRATCSPRWPGTPTSPFDWRCANWEVPVWRRPTWLTPAP